MLKAMDRPMPEGRFKDKGLPASLTLKEWLMIVEHFRWGCAFCDGKFESIEHVVRIADGGGTTADNCVPACLDCNQLHGVVLGRLERVKLALAEL